MRIGQPKRMLSGWRGTGDSGRDTHQECFVVDLEEGADHGERRARLVAVVDGGRWRTAWCRSSDSKRGELKNEGEGANENEFESDKRTCLNVSTHGGKLRTISNVKHQENFSLNHTAKPYRDSAVEVEGKWLTEQARHPFDGCRGTVATVTGGSPSARRLGTGMRGGRDERDERCRRRQRQARVPREGKVISLRRRRSSIPRPGRTRRSGVRGR
ncbi:hypothetical protein C8J57DRAFT_1245585 [Mycena rebaudengoi]|nr:hypothetical protein C8J57DRAFT_1245585 [Mycena rebaudengoi]